MFAESTRFCLYERSIYLYIMSIPFSRPFLFSLLYSIYYIYIQKWKYSFPPTIFFTPTFLPFLLYIFIILSIYREYAFPQLFTLFPPFPLLLLYSLYIEEGTLFPPPFLPLYIPLIKWTHFPPPLSLSFWNVTYVESLRGKVFENFISIVL